MPQCPHVVSRSRGGVSTLDVRFDGHDGVGAATREFADDPRLAAPTMWLVDLAAHMPLHAPDAGGAASP